MAIDPTVHSCEPYAIRSIQKYKYKNSSGKKHPLLTAMAYTHTCFIAFSSLGKGSTNPSQYKPQT
jgi:hypothetical protein